MNNATAARDLTASEIESLGLQDALGDRSRRSTAPAYTRGYDAGIGFRFPITDAQRRLNVVRFGRERA